MNQDKNKKFISDCFKTNTPIFLITTSDEWISGYINSDPESLFFTILDYRENEVRKIFYSRVHIAKEFRGDISKLIVPNKVHMGGK